MKASQNQAMLAIVKRQINDLQYLLDVIKPRKAILFDNCIPEDSSTISDFHKLNNLRTFTRQIKTKIANLAKLSKDLKNEIRGNNV